ncbi:iron siderophore-binding protein [Streptomyces inusitatus]|uniref:Iron siderophore-binding protein n=1 Tax=Streptomyces inusitatus TaxID=68221 RepID=A0A918Q8I4_9ACTN|nr:ABC transporter substrate-binding protein [Streptomyces inusitatus]GGZ37896.1 iron siderophore-binding protein [Streptomyces inusitatus]
MTGTTDRERSLSRRGLLSLGAVLGSTALLAACGKDETKASAKPSGGANAKTFPVTVRDKFGTVEIPEEPKRVLSLGRTDHDVLLALGIVPVGVWQFIPTMKRGVGVWAEKALGSQTPAFLKPPYDYERVASLTPDLIVNVQSGGDATEYKTLTDITRTVGLPAGATPNAVPWRESTKTIAAAVGRTARGDRLIADTEALLRSTAEANPAFAGKTVSILLAFGGKIGVYTAGDTRMQLVTALGLKPSAYVESLGDEKYFVELSAEKAGDADADVVILLSQQQMPLKQTLAQYPQIGAMKAARENRLVFPSDPSVGLALSSASVLSIPYAVKGLEPLLAKALKK